MYDKYQVSWKYIQNRKKQPIGTHCIINISIPTNGNDKIYEPLVTGTAKCYAKDVFNKKVGRKVSFERAVEQIPNRVERKLLWAEFIKHSPKCLSCH